VRFLTRQNLCKKPLRYKEKFTPKTKLKIQKTASNEAVAFDKTSRDCKDPPQLSAEG
jgi:hypothetical protein